VSPLQQLSQAITDGDEQAAPRLVQEALDAEQPARTILDDGLLAGMNEVGRRFREGEFFIPEVLIAAEALKAGLDVLQPQLVAQGVKAAATAVIGTVEGDLHDIGKNLVAMMLTGAGFEVIDLGVDVSADKFIDACRRQPVQVVALSALLTTTMPQMQSITRRVKAEVQPPPAVIIGGAPVTAEYANEIGADGYGRDAATGAEVARQMLRAPNRP